MSKIYYSLVNSVSYGSELKIEKIDYTHDDMSEEEVLEDLNDIAALASQQFYNCLILTEEDMDILKATLKAGIPDQQL